MEHEYYLHCISKAGSFISQSNSFTSKLTAYEKHQKYLAFLENCKDLNSLEKYAKQITSALKPSKLNPAHITEIDSKTMEQRCTACGTLCKSDAEFYCRDCKRVEYCSAKCQMLDTQHRRDCIFLQTFSNEELNEASIWVIRIREDVSTSSSQKQKHGSRINLLEQSEIPRLTQEDTNDIRCVLQWLTARHPKVILIISCIGSTKTIACCPQTSSSYLARVGTPQAHSPTHSKQEQKIPENKQERKQRDPGDVTVGERIATEMDNNYNPIASFITNTKKDVYDDVAMTTVVTEDVVNPTQTTQEIECAFCASFSSANAKHPMFSFYCRQQLGLFKRAFSKTIYYKSRGGVVPLKREPEVPF